MNKPVKYNNFWYINFEHCKYAGTSIISGKKWKAGDSIYWNMQVKNGFLASESNSKELSNSKSETKYHRGPVNSEWTYDDDRSRRLAMQVFKKHYNVELSDNPGLYMINKQDNNYAFIEFTNGKYCEDLVGFTDSNLILVEVERSKIADIFDEKNNKPIKILASKYWKYFDDGNRDHKHYMCFINEELMKACVIEGKDIKFNRGNYCTIEIDGKLKEFYEIPKQYAKIYELDKSLEALIDSCSVDYIPM